jgi:Xaa-Pro aminopeptidase
MNREGISGRVARLRERLGQEGADVFVLVVAERYNSESMTYLSGFRGSSGALVVSEDRNYLLTDGRYALQARAESPFDIVIVDGGSLQGKTADILRQGRWETAGFEAERLSVSIFSALEPSVSVWKDCSGLLPSLRRRKEEGEAALIRKAAALAYHAYLEVLEAVREGMTEKEFNALLEYTLRKNGAEGGWRNNEFIVASGERSALPHGVPTDRAFRKGDIVTVDFGATVEGYMSDLTRNFTIGPLSPQSRDIQDTLLEAHQRAVEALRPGVEGKAVDAVARDVITRRGWGKHFPHGLGHGLGMEVHEVPRLSPHSRDVLEEGDVVTVEPGIYIEGWGGMRIEDDYLVTAGGAVCLSGGEGREAPAL